MSCLGFVCMCTMNEKELTAFFVGFILITPRHQLQSTDQMPNESKCPTSKSVLYNSFPVMRYIAPPQIGW